MSFLGKLFGTEKALTSVVDGVKDGLDALVYTEEEKASDAAKDRAAARGMVVSWMESTKGQNLARRLLALMIAFGWIIQYFAALGLNLVAVWVDDPLKLQQSANLISDNAEAMNGAVMLILAFYFAAPHMGSIAQAALTKFGRGK